MKLFIFKTNIRKRKTARFVKSILRKQLAVKEWTIDLDDIDRVMRVVVQGNYSEKDIIGCVTSGGVDCEPLGE